MIAEKVNKGKEIMKIVEIEAGRRGTLAEWRIATHALIDGIQKVPVDFRDEKWKPEIKTMKTVVPLTFTGNRVAMMLPPEGD